MGRFNSDEKEDRIIARLQRLDYQQEEFLRKAKQLEKKINNLSEKLEIADEVGQALEILSEALFAKRLQLLEEQISMALQEILDPQLQFRAVRSYKRGSFGIEFYIEKAGFQEDILKGQGGAVANIVSFGLRLYALAALGDSHSKFLVLDEPDCWIQPDIVPSLVQIIQLAAKKLGFQILLVSHHDSDYFINFADSMYILKRNRSQTIAEKQI